MSNRLSLLSTNTHILSIQDAARAFTVTKGLAFAPNGCTDIFEKPHHRHAPNCATACEDLVQVFGSAATFQNCLALPTISLLAGTDALSQEDRALTTSFGLGQGSGVADVPANVVEPIVNCLTGYVDWCRHDPTCAEGDVAGLADSCVTSRLSTTGNASFLIGDEGTGVQQCIERLCATITAPVSTDIAGVGLYASYVMQAGIVLIAFIALQWWDFGLYYTSLLAYLPRHGYVEARRRAQRIHYKQIKHQERLIVALVEFQKTQCFFMLAIQIAAIVVIHRGLLGASNLEQIYIDTYVLTELAVGGMLPITFILFGLRTVGHRSLYLLVLSLVVWVLSAATWYLSSQADPTRNLSALVPAARFPNCGLASPSSSCLNYNVINPWFANSFNLHLGSVLYFSIVVLAFLFLDSYELHQRQGFKDLWATMGRWLKGIEGIAMSQTVLNVSSRVGLTSFKEWRQFLFGLVSLAVVVYYVAFFVVYLDKLRDFLKRSNFELAVGSVLNFSSWGFGQIVALTIWLPPLCEYVKLEVGMIPPSPSLVTSIKLENILI